MPKRTYEEAGYEQTLKKEHANYILTDMIRTCIKNGLIGDGINMLALEGKKAGTTHSVLSIRGLPLHVIVPNNNATDYEPMKKKMKKLEKENPQFTSDPYYTDAHSLVGEDSVRNCNVVYLDFCQQLACNTTRNTCFKTINLALQNNDQDAILFAVTYSEMGARNSMHVDSIKQCVDKTNLSKCLVQFGIFVNGWAIADDAFDKDEFKRYLPKIEFKDVEVYDDHIHLGPYGPNRMNTLYFVLKKVSKPQTAKINRLEKEIVRCLKKDTLCKVCGHVCPWKGAASCKKLVVCCACEDSDSDTCVYSDSSEDEESSDEEVDENEHQTYTGAQLQKLEGKKCEVKWRGKWALANVVESDGCALQWIEDTYYEPTKVSKKSKWCVRNISAQNKFIGFLEQDELPNFVGETFYLYWCKWLKVKMLKTKNKNYAHFEILSGAKKGTTSSFRMSSVGDRLGVCNPVMMSKYLYNKKI